jgi:hypothetical protein
MIAFLRQRKAALTLIGAIIVLATYIIKDILRDNKREARAAVENARRVFLLGRGIDGLSANAADTSRLLRTAISHLPAQEKSSADAWHFLPARDEVAEDLLRRLHNEITYLEQGLLLCDVVSGSEDTRKTLKEDITYFRDVAIPKLTQLISEVAPVIMSGPLSPPEAAKAIEDETNLIMLERNVKSALDKTISVRTVLGDLLQKAEREQDDAARRYENFALWSNVLFIVGVLIGLCAQLAGIEPAGAA